MPALRIHALDVAEHGGDRLLRRLKLVLHRDALLAELGADSLRLAKHLHVDQPRPSGVLVATADGSTVGHRVAVHGHAVEVSAARVLDRDVDVAADEDVPENLVHRGSNLVVVANLAQHGEDVLGIRVLAVPGLQSVQGQEGDATALLLVQVRDDLGRHVVIVHDDVEQLVRSGSFHRSEKPLVALHELNQRAVHARDAVVLDDLLHRGESAEQFAGHGELQVLIASLHLLGLGRQLGVELGVAALKLLALILRRVSRRDLLLVFALGLRERRLLRRELLLEPVLVLALGGDGLPELLHVVLEDGHLLAFAIGGGVGVGHLRAEPLVPLLLRLELRAPALPLVQHLQTAVHLPNLRLGRFFACSRRRHLGLDGVDLGARLGDGSIERDAIARDAREPLLASLRPLAKLRHVEFRARALLDAPTEFEVRDAKLFFGGGHRAFLILALSLGGTDLVVRPVRAVVLLLRAFNVRAPALLDLV